MRWRFRERWQSTSRCCGSLARRAITGYMPLRVRQRRTVQLLEPVSPTTCFGRRRGRPRPTIGGWVREWVHGVALHLASSHPGEPLWRLLTARSTPTWSLRARPTCAPGADTRHVAPRGGWLGPPPERPRSPGRARRACRGGRCPRQPSHGAGPGCSSQQGRDR